jgi:hypothetical protein
MTFRAGVSAPEKDEKEAKKRKRVVGRYAPATVPV